MHLRHIRVFLAIVEHGSIRAAARRMGMSQPAFTKTLRELETILAAPLVVRSMRGITLTEYGRAFLARAKLADAELLRAREEISQMLGATGGNVAIGLSPVASLLLSSDAITAFWNQHPDVNIKVLEGLFEQLLSSVAQGALDFAIGPLPQASTHGIEVEKLFEHRIVPVVGVNHPLAHRRSLADLQKSNWLLTSSDAGYRKLVEDLFRSHGLVCPRIAIVCESFPGFLELLSQTDLVAALPSSILTHEVVCSRVLEIPVKEIMPVTVIALVRKAQTPLTPAAELLAHQFRRIGHRFGNIVSIP
jgi:LysR family transcriptional regulator of abg operon